MSKKNSNINWPEIMENFTKHEGSIIDFCRSNNLIQSQLYNQRKKLNKKKETQVFHVLEVPIEEPIDIYNQVTSIIKIEIGKARIFLPIATLVKVVKKIKVILI